MIIVNAETIWQFWSTIWGALGTLLTLFLIYYLLFPEKAERIIVHAMKLLAYINKNLEKKYIARDLKLLITSDVAKHYSLQEIPQIRVEWGDEERVIYALERGELVIRLKRLKLHEDNIAKALVLAIPYMLSPDVELAYDKGLVTLISSHIAKHIARNKPAVISAINKAVEQELNGNLRNLIPKLIEIDNQSLMSKILIPKIIENAHKLAPHKDPRLTQETIELINLLHQIATGEASNPIICGKYVKMAFVRVAKPEKQNLEPHLRYVQHVLRECKGLKEIYILAAGKNIKAAKLLTWLIKERMKTQTIEEHEYKGTYKDKPNMKLYLAKIVLA